MAAKVAELFGAILTEIIVLPPKIADEFGSEFSTKYFTHPDEGDEYYAKELDLLAQNMNDLVEATQRRGKESKGRDAALEIGFLRTINGYLPVWKRDVSKSERLEDLVDISILKPLGSMTGEDVKAYLQIEGSDGTWYAYEKSGGIYKCKGSGEGCFVTVASVDGFRTSQDSNYFPKVAASSSVYDPDLSDLADKLNAALNATQKNEFERSRQSEPRLEIGLAVGENGIQVVWKIVTSA